MTLTAMKPWKVLIVVSILMCSLTMPGCIGLEPLDSTRTITETTSATGNTTIYLPPLKYDYTAAITHNEIERTFIVHIGLSYDADSPTPLVFALHGGGGTAEGMPGFTGFNAIADRENFIVVYPDGVENHWNDGREPKVYRTHLDNTDDTGFISMLIDVLARDLNIDMKRVYATGISNGGMMSHRLGCELSERIAAIAPVASGIPANMADKWDPSGPISVLIMNGTHDPIIPWEGGEIRMEGIKLGTTISVADTVRFWVDKNGCTVNPEITRLTERNETDGTSVWMEVYSACTDGVEVALFGIENGGHTWPGGFQYAAEHIIGKTSREFDASEIIWQFFKTHPKP